MSEDKVERRRVWEDYAHFLELLIYWRDLDPILHSMLRMVKRFSVDDLLVIGDVTEFSRLVDDCRHYREVIWMIQSELERKLFEVKKRGEG
ncbi:MAG: hypothetical protein LM590_14840 [Thermofilum sp.]|nr:hypothetical protein [Thermofilum sp.]